MSSSHKHSPLTGFDATTMEDRLSKFKRFKPEGDWRRNDRISVIMTVLCQTWCYDGNEKLVIINHICPWGMKLYYSSVVSRHVFFSIGFSLEVSLLK